MQISTLAIVAVTTVVMTITDIVTTLDKIGGVDVFWLVMEDQWGLGGDYDDASAKDSAKKTAFYKCLHDQVFDFGTTSDDRQARFGGCCAKYAVIGHADAFFKFGTDGSSETRFCHGEMPQRANEPKRDWYNSISAVLAASHEYVFKNMRPTATLVSIVIAGKEVKDGSLNQDNRKYEEDGNLLFIVTMVEPLASKPVGNVPDYRNVHFDGTCSTDFAENFKRAICTPRISVMFNATECILKPGATSECHQNVTYKPEVKHDDVVCQKYPPKVTDEDCPCNGTTLVPETTTAKISEPETTTQSGVPIALITGLVIGGVVVIIVVIALVIVVVIRRRERQRRILATKMVVGDVTKSQMSRASAFGGKSQMSRAQTQSKKRDESQMSKKTQKTKSQMSKTQQQKSQMSKTQQQKSQMSKTQQQKSQMSKTQQQKSQMSKTQQQKSQMSKTQQQKSQAPKSQVPQKSSKMSKSPSSKVKAGKSQMYNSPTSKVAKGKSQMGKASKMSRK